MRPLRRIRKYARVTNSTGNPRHELSQFRAPEKERTRKIKEEEDASSRSYEIFKQQNNILEMMEMIEEKKNVSCESNAVGVARVYIVGV